MRSISNTSPRTVRGHNLLAGALTLFATLLALPGHGAVLPDIPLQAGAPVPPNIMFVLDDSGSMHWEMMPDSLVSATYVFPRANGIYGGTDYGNNVATVDDTNAYNARTRSPQVNKIYYNPAVTYLPWATSDGSLFPTSFAACALHNPQRIGVGPAFCRDLTVDATNYNTNSWCNGSVCTDTSARTYWPATYFWYNGGADTDRASYTKVEIRTGSLYSGQGRAARTDCAAGTCTYAQEMQNFANWYTYYRSRILSARAGIGRAFSGLSTGTAESPPSRVGFSTINTAGAVVAGVRVFAGADRVGFFDNLYNHVIPAAGTPLRRALDDVGKYYQTKTGVDDPWNTTPGITATTPQLSCRASYSILMTDGYWNGAGASSPANGDTEAGQGLPFEDGRSDTLADVAMHYWKTDLRGLANNVPRGDIDTATWQHMVTFGVGLGVFGTLDPATAFAAIATQSPIVWPDPNASDAGKIDDLLHASVNSRGGFFSAANPTEFAEGLGKVLTSIGDRVGSGSNVAANSVALKEETRLFQASYKPGVWTGELQSFKVTPTGINAIAEWSASTGIPATGRKLFTSTGAATAPGAVFPTAFQTTTLGNSPKGFSIAAYLAGNRTGEIKGTLPETGDLRRRVHLLGDIVNSSPAYVKDTDTLFVGANDGMMHAINASTGAEVFAYVPNASTTSALAKLKLLSSPGYSHKFYVDGPVSVSSDLDTPAKHYLVGALGRGGKGVYFLDVTDPTTFGTANVTSEYAPATDNDMGNVLGKPIIANVLIGTGTPVETPVAIVSNGVNSTNGSATVYVFNLATGALLKKIVASSPAAKDNGLSTPRGWDYDGDGYVDNVYAGDLKGNVWKFDIGSTKISDWGVDLSGLPLFVAKDALGVPQPITGGMSVALDPVSFKPYVFFGTGKYLEQSDVADGLGVPNTSIQTWYGIRDENAAITTGRAALQQRFIKVAGTTTASDGTVRATRGFERHAPLPGTKKGWFVDLVEPPNPPGTARGERMVGDPFMLGRVLVAASIIPSPDPCSGGGSGYLNAIDAFTGTSVKAPFFDTNGDGNFDDDTVGSGADQVPVGSFDPGVAMPTSPTIIETLVVVGGSTGTTSGVKVSNPLLKARISWREILGE